MNTKNKRKYQNKPVQRNNQRPAAPAPKFKNKKEKFIKETLPCIVLLVFMLFWSIGSALSIIDKVKSHKSNTSMITASADTPSYTQEGIMFTLDGFRGMYFDDSTLNLCVDVFTVYLNKDTGSLTISNSQDSFEFFMTSNFEMQTEFLYDGGFFGSSCSMSVEFDENFNGFMVNSYVDFIAYSQVDEYVQAQISVVNGYNNLSVFTIKILDVDLFPVYLSSVYSDEFNPPASSLINENNQLRDLVQSLENQVKDLQSNADSNYQMGYNDGKEIGRIEGIESANEYSFMGLIGAVVDVPVRAFMSLFDIDILGINMKDFFFAVLSLALILAVIKWVMAK